MRPRPRTGVRLRGTLAGADACCLLLLGDDGHLQLVHKHAVTTVQPEAPLAPWDGDVLPAAPVAAAMPSRPPGPRTLTLAGRARGS